MDGLKCLVAVTLFSVLAAPAWAATYRLPPAGEDVIGAISIVEVRDGETLIDIAREHGLGYNEIVAANPALDPWVPPVGAEVILPTRYVLPSAPRRGIIINIAEMRLYYYPPAAADGSGMVLTFPIGIGQEGWATPLGITRIISKAEDPPWVVPASVRREHEAEGTPLPAVVPPGPDNPLGRHALRLGWTSYLIHGTNKPFGIGMRVSHGCIRMYAEHVERLYHMVQVDTPVWIIDQPVKLGRSNGELFFEAHPAASANGPPADHLSTVLAVIDVVTMPEDVTAAREAAGGSRCARRACPNRLADWRHLLPRRRAAGCCSSAPSPMAATPRAWPVNWPTAACRFRYARTTTACATCWWVPTRNMPRPRQPSKATGAIRDVTGERCCPRIVPVCWATACSRTETQRRARTLRAERPRRTRSCCLLRLRALEHPLRLLFGAGGGFLCGAGIGGGLLRGTLRFLRGLAGPRCIAAGLASGVQGFPGRAQGVIRRGLCRSGFA